jgi:hypothetical protein
MPHTKTKPKKMFSKFWIQTPLKEVVVDDEKLMEVVVIC